LSTTPIPLTKLVVILLKSYRCLIVTHNYALHNL